MTDKIRVGITHGDFNGISYELILKIFAEEGMNELCTPVIFGSAKLMAFFKKMFDLENVRFNIVKSAEDVKDGEYNLVNISDKEFKVQVGEGTEESGEAAFLSLEAATKALKDGLVDVLVTAPINKHAIHGEQFPYSGHTEYMETKFGENNEKALMILFDSDKEVRVALVTTHLAVKDIADAITEESVEETIRLFDRSLRRDFRVERPKIAVLALNPHCGDHGTIGYEESRIIEPVIKRCFEEGILAFGPFAADGFFGSGAYKNYDGIVAMYHDQGLAPFKTLCATRGVNFTAGLPVVRTSPDHGTGYDIAGSGKADPESFRQAIFEAIDILRNRKHFDEACANPLKKQYEARGADKTIDLSAESDET